MNAVVVIAAIAVVGACLVWNARSARQVSRAVAFLLRVDPPTAGARLSNARGTAEPLAAAIDDLLTRMESERRTSARQQLAEREEERAAISRELHDEIGQLLTAALLQLDQAETRPDDPRPLVAARKATEAAFEEVRALSRRVRPLVAADLEPVDALSAMAGSIVHRAGSELVLDVDPAALDMLDRYQRLVAFRVAHFALGRATSENGTAPIQLRVLRQWPLVTLQVSWLHHATALPAQRPRQLREWAVAGNADIDVSANPDGRCAVTLALRPLANGAGNPL